MTDKVWGISMVCNEDDIISHTLSHLIAEKLDGIIVCDHCSDDNTKQALSFIKDMYPDKIVVTSEHNRAYYQSEILTSMANNAYDLGATWVVPFDADELFYSWRENSSLADEVRGIDSDVIGVALWNHFETNKDEYGHPNPFLRYPWRHINRNPLDKCITRWKPGYTIDNGNHQIFNESKKPIPAVAAALGARHFAARGLDMWVKKSIKNGIGLREAKNLHQGVGSHARGYFSIYERFGVTGMKDFYKTWFYYQDPQDNDQMVYDPAPYKGDL